MIAVIVVMKCYDCDICDKGMQREGCRQREGIIVRERERREREMKITTY
jgi:hypothetical protein